MEGSSGEDYASSADEKPALVESTTVRIQSSNIKVSNGIPNGVTSEHRHSSKHKDHKSSKDRDKHRDHSKHKHDKDKHHSSSKDKDKDRHHSSSSKDKHKHRDKHHSDKHKESKDKDGKEHKSSHHRSSSSKDGSKSVDKSSSSHHKEKSDKDKSKSKGKDRHSSPDKHKSKIDSNNKEVKVKIESGSPQKVLSPSKFPIQPKIEVPSPKRELPPKFKQEVESDEDKPLLLRRENQSKKRVLDSDDEDIPLSQRKKLKKKPDSTAKKSKKRSADSEDEFKPEVKKAAPASKKKANNTSVASSQSGTPSPTKRGKKKAEEEQEVWKWWEESKPSDGTKWTFLEHKGPVFAPLYTRLPKSVRFFYNGKPMQLTEETEEVATFYGRMIDHDYTTKPVFNTNFFKDWRKVMTSAERETITDLKKCDFTEINDYFKVKSEERKAMSKEEKQKIKEENERIVAEYGVCTIDGHKEKIGNFKIEPPSLFRGRGEHPKMGMLKKRVQPEDVIINCSKNSKIPVPPAGHKWKEVRHSNDVTWLASWTENVQGQTKYVMLNPSSKLKGEKDWQKYETARKLAKHIDRIRDTYRGDWKSKEMRIRQRAVALYFIDKLALRAGNEKDEDQADTVGCCSLRVEHIALYEEKDGKEYVVAFDFLGKDSIRYYNEVSVEKRVFKNLELFVENKQKSDDLFDRLNTSILNKYLNELMDGLTAKVFRTYNASITLQQQLDQLTPDSGTPQEMVLAYNRANRAVAVLCNHQRAVPKTHQKSMENLKNKIDAKLELVQEAERALKDAKKEYKRGKSQKEKVVVEKKEKALERLRDQLSKLEVQATDREENKEIALGTSKLNYLDPRISVAWCKKYDIPIEKIYNKTQRMKFRWAIDMAGPEFVF